MRNLAKNELKDLTGKIVEDCFPNELIAFSIFADEQIDDIYNGEDLFRVNRNKAGEFEAGVSVSEVVNYVSVIVGTFKVLLEIYKMIKDNKTAPAESIWEESLVKAGIEREDAKKISKKYMKDIASKLIDGL